MLSNCSILSLFFFVVTFFGRCCPYGRTYAFVNKDATPVSLAASKDKSSGDDGDEVDGKLEGLADDVGDGGDATVSLPANAEGKENAGGSDVGAEEDKEHLEGGALETAASDLIIPELPADCCPECCYVKFACCCIFDDSQPLFAKYKLYRSQAFALVENKYFETIVVVLILTSSLALVSGVGDRYC